LSDHGYTSFGFSPNSFASASHGFDLGFDHFEFTQYLACHDGINPAQYYRAFSESEDEAFSTGLQVGSRLLQDLAAKIPNSSDRLTSTLANLAVAAGYQARETIPLLSRLYPPLVKQAGIRPSEINTRKIESVIERESQRKNPFFMFANYTDTHYPYIPPEDIQTELFGQALDREELISMNEEYAQEWEFMKKAVSGGGVPESTLEKIRALYAGEVRATDRHLARICSALESNDISEDTVIVITADHGENLGESCIIDGPRMGHLATVSDHVTRVPLVVFSPGIDETTVSEPVPLKNVRYMIESIARGENNPKELLEAMRPEEDYVASHATPNGVPELYERHPELPDAVLRTEVTESRVVVYKDDWKVVASTHREPVIVRENSIVPTSDAPEELVRVATEQAKTLGDGQTSADEPPRNRLQQLGYL
jgi:arylsulfatase A-like enzyme